MTVHPMRADRQILFAVVVAVVVLATAGLLLCAAWRDRGRIGAVGRASPFVDAATGAGAHGVRLGRRVDPAGSGLGSAPFVLGAGAAFGAGAGFLVGKALLASWPDVAERLRREIEADLRRHGEGDERDGS